MITNYLLALISLSNQSLYNLTLQNLKWLNLSDNFLIEKKFLTAWDAWQAVRTKNNPISEKSDVWDRPLFLWAYCKVD